MTLEEMTQRARDQFHNLCKLPVSALTSVSRDERHCTVLLEAVERKGIPDTMDILGLYEIRLDNEGNMVSFERKSLRKRGQTGQD